jgi:hypothetical protein
LYAPASEKNTGWIAKLLQLLRKNKGHARRGIGRNSTFARIRKNRAKPLQEENAARQEKNTPKLFKIVKKQTRGNKSEKRVSISRQEKESCIINIYKK